MVPLKWRVFDIVGDPLSVMAGKKEVEGGILKGKPKQNDWLFVVRKLSEE